MIILGHFGLKIKSTTCTNCWRLVELIHCVFSLSSVGLGLTDCRLVTYFLNCTLKSSLCRQTVAAPPPPLNCRRPLVPEPDCAFSWGVSAGMCGLQIDDVGWQLCALFFSTVGQLAKAYQHSAHTLTLSLSSICKCHAATRHITVCYWYAYLFFLTSSSLPHQTHFFQSSISRKYSEGSLKTKYKTYWTLLKSLASLVEMRVCTRFLPTREFVFLADLASR